MFKWIKVLRLKELILFSKAQTSIVQWLAFE